jgi:hypothetical protein
MVVTYCSKCHRLSLSLIIAANGIFDRNHANGQTRTLLGLRPATLLTLASFAVVVGDARPTGLLALASDAVVLADAHSRPVEFSAGGHVSIHTGGVHFRWSTRTAVSVDHGYSVTEVFSKVRGKHPAAVGKDTVVIMFEITMNVTTTVPRFVARDFDGGVFSKSVVSTSMGHLHQE